MIGCKRLPSSRNLATYWVENIQRRKVNTPHEIGGSRMYIHKLSLGAPPVEHFLSHLLEWIKGSFFRIQVYIGDLDNGKFPKTMYFDHGFVTWITLVALNMFPCSSTIWYTCFMISMISFHVCRIYIYIYILFLA